MHNLQNLHSWRTTNIQEMALTVLIHDLTEFQNAIFSIIFYKNTYILGLIENIFVNGFKGIYSSRRKTKINIFIH